jgi:hypothetical protein
MNRNPQPSILSAAIQYWKDEAARTSGFAATRSLLVRLWEFARNSTPARLRQRYGDADYDWDHRVSTTSAAVGSRDRLLGAFYSSYQPTDPALFHEMLDTIQQQANLNFAEFTFLDLGSGKGRTLLMASDYPFRRIIGVELLPSLNHIAQENLRAYRSESQKCFSLQSICADASRFLLPEGPLVVYLFNPFPEPGLHRFTQNLEQSLRDHPRPMYVVYHNPLLEHVLLQCSALRKIHSTHQYSVFRVA